MPWRPLIKLAEREGSGLKEEQLDVLAALNATASALSLLGSSAIVLTYIVYAELRRFSFKLVFLLSIAVCAILSSVSLLHIVLCCSLGLLAATPTRAVCACGMQSSHQAI